MLLFCLDQYNLIEHVYTNIVNAIKFDPINVLKEYIDRNRDFWNGKNRQHTSNYTLAEISEEFSSDDYESLKQLNLNYDVYTFDSQSSKIFENGCIQKAYLVMNCTLTLYNNIIKNYKCSNGEYLFGYNFINNTSYKSSFYKRIINLTYCDKDADNVFNFNYIKEILDDDNNLPKVCVLYFINDKITDMDNYITYIYNKFKLLL